MPSPLATNGARVAVAHVFVAYAAVAYAAVTCAACTATPTASAPCQRDDQCDTASACVVGACVPRLAAPTSWAIEIAPPTGGPAAFTELASLDVSTMPLVLAATTTTTVTGALTLEASVTPLGAAHVLLTVPAGIAGRPDLLFETDLPPGTDAAMPTFSLPVPTGILSRVGTLLILPSSPDDLTHAPAVFTPTVAPAMVATISAKMFTVRGRLLSPLMAPRPGFVARAYLGDDLVSNVVTTANDGTFALMVPASLVGPADAISVRLAPAPTDAADPRYAPKPFPLQADTDLGDLQLPALGQPNAFRFFVTGGDAAGPDVPGALVRTYTAVFDDAGGTTDFLRDGVTSPVGRTDLALLPGTTAALRLYTIAVVPPADSAYATTCFTEYPLAGGGSTMVPANLPTLVLPKRTVVSGTVRGDDGSPVAGVMLVATPSPAVTASPCAPLAGTPAATVTTDMHGTYEVFLDTGSYRFDFDPPDGASVPRLTEPAVAVAAPPTDGAPLIHDVRLPPGALLEGTTVGPDALPLPLASVRFYQSTCAPPATCQGASAPAPLLQAEVHADATGHFRAVVPTAPSASTP